VVATVWWWQRGTGSAGI